MLQLRVVSEGVRQEAPSVRVQRRVHQLRGAGDWFVGFWDRGARQTLLLYGGALRNDPAQH
jgi:hypothetical protein